MPRVRCVRALRSVRSAFGLRSRSLRSGLAFGAFGVLRSGPRSGTGSVAFGAFGTCVRGLRSVRSAAWVLSFLRSAFGVCVRALRSAAFVGFFARSDVAFGLRSGPRVRDRQTLSHGRSL